MPRREDSPASSSNEKMENIAMESLSEANHTSIHLQMLIATCEFSRADQIKNLVPMQPELTVAVFVTTGFVKSAAALAQQNYEIAFVEQRLLSSTDVFHACLKFISNDDAIEPKSRAFVLIDAEADADAPREYSANPEPGVLHSIKNTALKSDCSFFRTKLIHLNQELVYFILLQAWEHARKASLVSSIVAASNQHAIVATTDKEGNITYANDLFCKISGYGIEELLGKNHRILSAQYHPPEFFRELWKTISAGKVWSGAIKNRSKSGRYFWLQTTIVPVTNSTGDVISYVTMRTDITAVKESSELSLKQVSDKANFLANISHEIRSPLQSILGATDLLRKSQDTDSQQELLGILTNSAESLLALVNDMLDLTKIEVGRVSLEIIPFALQELADAVYSLFNQAARAKEIELKFSMPTERSLFLGDPSRIKQILINLLSNAIKFTNSGSVSLEVVWNEEAIQFPMQNQKQQLPGQQAGTLSLIVSDTGIGMSKQVLNSLFQPFVQANNAIHRKFGGTGLGLSIVKNLVHLMDGKIEVRSVENKGSTFSVSLPVFSLSNHALNATIAEEEIDRQRPRNKIRNKAYCGSVVLVEDDPLCRKVTKLILENEGYQLFEFENGQSAIDFMKGLAENDEHLAEIKAILLDSGLPDISGLQVAKQIQEMGRATNAIPIIGLSGNSFDGVSLREFGFKRWLIKPVNTMQLLSCLSSLETN